MIINPKSGAPLEELYAQLAKGAPAIEKLSTWNWNLRLDSLSKNSAEQIRAVFEHPDGSRRTERQIAEDIAVMQVIYASRIRQIKGEGGEEGAPRNPLWAVNRTGDTHEMFMASRDSTFKRVQRVLTDEDDLRAGDGAVANTIITPDKVSSALLENLGLEKYNPKGRMKRSDRMERRDESIPDLKTTLGELAPLPTSPDSPRSKFHHRMHRITSGPNANNLLITQESGRKLTFFATGLFGADGRLGHIDANYSQEIQKLAGIRALLQRVHKSIIAPDWATFRDSGQLTTTRTSLAEAVESLEYVENKHKRRLRDVISSIKNVEDKNKRLNPSAVAAQLVQLVQGNFFDQRVEEITAISGYLGQDRILLRNHIASQQAGFREIYDGLEEYGERNRLLEDGHHLTEREAARIKHSIATYQPLCAQATFEPFVSFAERMTKHLTNLSGTLDDAVTSGDNTTAQHELMSAFLIAKLERFYSGLMKMYEEVSVSNGRVPVQDLEQELAALSTMVLEKRVAPKIFTPEFNDIWRKSIRGLIQKLEDYLAELGETTKPEERKVVVEAFKETVQKFVKELVEMVRS